MSKYTSIYMWDNVENIIHIIGSIIDFKSNTTDLYDTEFFSKTYDGCSLQSDSCISKLAKMKNPFGVGYVFKSYCYCINQRFSKFQGLYHSRINEGNFIFPAFYNEFLPSLKNVILNGQHIIYPLKQVDIFQYNHRCIISMWSDFWWQNNWYI